MPLAAARPDAAVRGGNAGGSADDGAGAGYNGLYFVLMGRLSPLDGIGPKDIHLDRLVKRAPDGVGEGNDTCDQFHRGRRGDRALRRRAAARAGHEGTASRAGLPVGGELEHVDSGTLAQAVIERRPA